MKTCRKTICYEECEVWCVFGSNFEVMRFLKVVKGQNVQKSKYLKVNAIRSATIANTGNRKPFGGERIKKTGKSSLTNSTEREEKEKKNDRGFGLKKAFRFGRQTDFGSSSYRKACLQ